MRRVSFRRDFKGALFQDDNAARILRAEVKYRYYTKMVKVVEFFLRIYDLFSKLFFGKNINSPP